MDSGYFSSYYLIVKIAKFINGFVFLLFMNKLYTSLTAVVIALSPVESMGQQVAAGQGQNVAQKDTSIAEQLLKTFHLFDSDSKRHEWAQAYDPAVGYLLKYQDVAQEIWKLDMVQYKNKHFLDASNVYRTGRVQVSLGSNAVDFTVWKDYTQTVSRSNVHMMYLSALYDFHQTEHFDSEKGKMVQEDHVISLFKDLTSIHCESFSRNNKRARCEYNIDLPKEVIRSQESLYTYSSDEINQIYFTAKSLASIVLADLQVRDAQWKAMPWREVKPEFRGKDPVDKKSGEFVFYGEDGCGPCVKVANFLFDHKIKFVERNIVGAPGLCSGTPYMLEGKQCYGSSSGTIIDLAKKMYDFSEPKVEPVPSVSAPAVVVNPEQPVKKSRFKQK